MGLGTNPQLAPNPFSEEEIFVCLRFSAIRATIQLMHCTLYMHYTASYTVHITLLVTCIIFQRVMQAILWNVHSLCFDSVIYTYVCIHSVSFNRQSYFFISSCTQSQFISSWASSADFLHLAPVLSSLWGLNLHYFFLVDRSTPVFIALLLPQPCSSLPLSTGSYYSWPFTYCVSYQVFAKSVGFVILSLFSFLFHIALQSQQLF